MFKQAEGAQPDPVESTLKGPNWSYANGIFDLVVPQVAFFRIQDDGVVWIWAQPGREHDVPVFLVGTVLGIALHLRGVIAIHASAVKVGDGAVLFCGPSGAGKSTTAAALGNRGYPVLSDDICGIENTPEGPMMYSDGRKLKLWSASIKKLALQELQGQSVREGFDKFFIDREGLGIGPQPVKAIFVLTRDQQAQPPQVTPLSLADAATAFRRNAYRPFLVRQLKAEPLYFQATAHLLRHASVHKLARDHDFSQLDDMLDVLVAHWTEMGLE